MLAVAVTACGGRATSDNEGGSTPESIDEPNLGDLHCEEGKGVESAEVVANQRGLFVAVTPTAAPGVVGGLYQRTGGAWARLEDETSGSLKGLDTLPNGTLLRFGRSGTCSIELVPETGKAFCNGGASEVGDVFVVRDDLAYATTENSVLVYDGSSWTELLTDHVGEEGYNYVYDVWANEQTIALTTTYGVYVGTPGEPLTRLPDLPADSGVYLSSVWATSAEDIWVAASSDLLRYQAGSWSKVWPNAAAEPSADCPGNVREIWGADGEVFFYTASSVHRYRDGQVETFFDVGCDPNVRVLDLWGVSPTEVYLTVQVLRSLDDCGAVEVLRFDGSRWGPVD